MKLVGLNQPVKGLKEKNLKSPEGEGIPPQIVFQIQSYDTGSSLSL